MVISDLPASHSLNDHFSRLRCNPGKHWWPSAEVPTISIFFNTHFVILGALARGEELSLASPIFSLFYYAANTEGGGAGSCLVEPPLEISAGLRRILTAWPRVASCGGAEPVALAAPSGAALRERSLVS